MPWNRASAQFISTESKSIHEYILLLQLKTNLQLADHVFVSTPDLLSHCNRAEFLPNPIDTEKFKPAKSTLDLHNGHDFAIFAPSRHDWRIKGQHIFIYALRKLVEQGYDCNMTMVNWGPDVDRSKQLAEKLEIKKT